MPGGGVEAHRRWSGGGGGGGGPSSVAQTSVHSNRTARHEITTVGQSLVRDDSRTAVGDEADELWDQKSGRERSDGVVQKSLDLLAEVFFGGGREGSHLFGFILLAILGTSVSCVLNRSCVLRIIQESHHPVHGGGIFSCDCFK